MMDVKKPVLVVLVTLAARAARESDKVVRMTASASPVGGSLRVTF